jgi:hypothetical protein
MSKSAQRQFLVKVSGIDGLFATKTGGDVTADANKVYDGGTLVPDVVAAPAEVDNVTVGRPYDPTRDASVLKRYRALVGRWETTLSCTPTDRDLIAVADPVVYSKALLVGVTEPEYDASSGDGATYELEFAVGGVS